MSATSIAVSIGDTPPRRSNSTFWIGAVKRPIKSECFDILRERLGGCCPTSSILNAVIRDDSNGSNGSNNRYNHDNDQELNNCKSAQACEASTRQKDTAIHKWIPISVMLINSI